VLSPDQVDWIRTHHERPNGEGYPDGLVAEEIPEGAALLAIADAWDVMTISRPYSSPKEVHEALEECRDLVGEQFTATAVAALLPPAATIERPACSTAGSAPDMVARIAGTGSRRLLLVGHVDTVISHDAHVPLRHEGERMYGPGTADMKGGVVLALGVARLLSERPELFDQVAVLLVTDEEWRTQEFVHGPTFAGWDACLCFEAGERTRDGGEGVVVRRKAAGTLR